MSPLFASFLSIFFSLFSLSSSSLSLSSSSSLRPINTSSSSSSSLSLSLTPFTSSFTLALDIFPLHLSHSLLSHLNYTSILFADIQFDTHHFVSFQVSSHSRIVSLSSSFLNCSFHQRLKRNEKEKQTLITQFIFQDYELITLLFVNEKLQNKCISPVNSSLFLERSGIFHTRNVISPIQSSRVQYWPSLLSYLEIQYLSLSSEQISLDPAEPSHHRSTPVVIFFWPYFYSMTETIHNSEILKLTHLIDSLFTLTRNLLPTLTSVTDLYYHIVIPLTAEHYQPFLALLSQKIPISSLPQFISIVPLDLSLSPSISSFSPPSFPHVMNFLLSHSENLFSLVSSLTDYQGPISSTLSSNPFDDQSCHIVLLSSRIHPTNTTITGLISALIAAGSNKHILLGGTIANLRNEIDSFGIELHEVNYVGGLDKFLVPHRRYRSFFFCDVLILVEAINFRIQG
jgi:hypothetical protein